MSNEILFNNLESPLGPMIVGSTDRGVCFLEWHDRGGVETILKRVAKRYGVQPVPGTCGHLDMVQTELNEYFAGARNSFETPLDFHGTPFELTVWRALLRIPYGETLGYGQLAETIGKPGAARAVGKANGANYISILIPCHRVIESNGSLRGYGGGLWRKEYLLNLERKAPTTPPFVRPELALNL